MIHPDIKHGIKVTLAKAPLIPKRYYCTVCNNRSTFFLPMGIKAEIFEKKKIIGGGYRRNVRCPLCGSTDRMRFLDYILKEWTDVYTNPDLSILHFAPEACIECKIKEKLGGGVSNYITGDINSGAADFVVDVTNICFPDHVFDYVIINHVLEHVQNERKAMDEIKRVLKADGKCVFTMPLCENENTYESELALTEKERLNLYGQKDHVRLYGKDVKSRMGKYGFHIREYKSDELLTENEIKNMRIIKGDRVLIGEIIGE